MNFSWEYEFTGAGRTWAVSTMFCLTGLICGLIIPYFMTPHATPDSIRANGTVIRMEQDPEDQSMEKPVFQYADREGNMQELSSGIYSNRSAYRAGDQVTVMFSPANVQNAFVVDDKDLSMVFWILYLLGIVFGGIGIAVLGMKLAKMDDKTISRIGGLIGALCYAIPATFVLPGLWIAYRLRPNALYAQDAVFGSDQWILGLVFTLTGLLALAITIPVYIYQARTGEEGWEWNWAWQSKKDVTEEENEQK